MGGNRYIVCTRHGSPVEFDISDDDPVADANIAYFIRAFRFLEHHYAFDGHIVCFAWSSTTPLPHLGQRVVAMVYGDEHCRVPPYVDQVGAVIKCHGFFPTYVPRLRPVRLAQIEAAEFLRNLALWLPTGWRWLVSPGTRSRCHLVPIGWGVTANVAPLPFAERPYIASFLASIPPEPERTSLRGLIGTPKLYCRRAASRVLARLAESYGPSRIRTWYTSGFQESLAVGADVYFDVMAKTRICIAPRGTTQETWRLSDGLRLGCVVIADRLPRHPFYEGSPIIEIADWRDLPSLLERLLRDPTKLEEMHRASFAYWRDVLSEQALTARLAAALKLQRRGTASSSPATTLELAGSPASPPR